MWILKKWIVGRRRIRNVMKWGLCQLQSHTSLQKQHADLMKAHKELLQAFKNASFNAAGGAAGAAAAAKKMVKHPALGVVRLDYDYPPAPGDSDHPASFGYDVYFRCVPGLSFEMCQTGQFTEEVERRFADAIKHLETTTSERSQCHHR